MKLSVIFISILYGILSQPGVKGQNYTIDNLKTIIASIPVHFNDLKGKVISSVDNKISYTSRHKSNFAESEVITKGDNGFSYVISYKNFGNNPEIAKIYNEYKAYFAELEQEGYQKKKVELLINNLKHKGFRYSKDDVPLGDMLDVAGGFAVAIYSYDE